MKKSLLFVAIVFASFVSYAQSPDLMSYQAVIRNASGILLAEKPVSMRVRILHKTELGNSAYIKTHTATTNKNGLVTIKIGAGTVVSGNISTIDWSDGPYFLQTETDPDGGTTYTINNISQMLSVPYALYAKSSGSDGASWSLSGNSATASDFFGTTNDRPIIFKSNNERVGYLGSGDKIFFGNGAGATNTFSNSTGISNVAIGMSALNQNFLGSNNVAIGDSALYNNEASENTAIGSRALYSNKSGTANTANGFESLYINTSGVGNTANGFHSLYRNTIGDYNTATGIFAIFSNTIGNTNTAIGYSSLFQNISGSHNTTLGALSLGYNTTGGSNVAIGVESLITNITGSNNTAIGYLADVSAANLTNATVMGSGAIVNASNKVRIGNTSVTKIEGQVAWSFPSDARFKYNIKNNVPGLEFIKRLQPVTYHFDNEKLNEYAKTGVINNKMMHHASFSGEKEIHTGFLAQEVEKTANELGYHFDGVRAPANDKDHYSLAYSQFIMPLVKAVQEQQEMIEQQKSVTTLQQKNIEHQNNVIGIQQNAIDKLQEMIKILEQKIEALSNK